MVTEYKLSYTAKDIDNKLKKVDKLVSTVNGVSPDANGNVRLEIGGASGSPPAIIDVMSLPTENINSGAFYRLLKADYVCYKDIINDDNYIIYCVDSLPETGEVVTEAEMSFMKFYYSVQNNDVYGYVDSLLASGFGFPSSGWVDYGTLCAFIGETYGGVITHIDKATDDNTWYTLLTKKLYTYDNGWKELPYAYESDPEFDVVWDGNMDEHFVLDMSQLGFDSGVYFIKVSDEFPRLSEEPNYDDVSGYCFDVTHFDDGFVENVEIREGVWVDNGSYPGALVISDFIIIVHSSSDTNSALGLPDGYITNGTYFLLNNTSDYNLYVSRFVSPKKVVKIDKKFVDVPDIDLDSLAVVATTGNYNDLYNRPTIYTDVVRYNYHQSLNSSQQNTVRSQISVYSKSEVDTKIANVASEGKIQSMIDTSISNAIGNAIGGSY